MNKNEFSVTIVSEVVMELSDICKTAKISATNAITSTVDNLKSSGVKIYQFNVGEPDAKLPQNIEEKAHKALSEGKTKYTDSTGLKVLREAIAIKLQKENDVSYTPSQIVVTNGAKQALFESIMALCNADDQVIIPTPCWVSYTDMVRLCHAKPVLVNTNNDYSLNIDNIKKAITSKTKAIIINSPNNPTGAVYSKESLKQLSDLAIENNLMIISDEVYEKIIYDDNKHISIASLSKEAFEHTITVNSFSKTYAMTGLRIGYVACPDNFAKAIGALQSQISGNVSTVSQYAALEALSGSQDSIAEMVKILSERREKMFNALKEKGFKPYKPQGAFYILCPVDQDDVEFAKTLLENEHIATVPGSAFYAPNTIRFSFSKGTL